MLCVHLHVGFLSPRNILGATPTSTPFVLLVFYCILAALMVVSLWFLSLFLEAMAQTWIPSSSLLVAFLPGPRNRRATLGDIVYPARGGAPEGMLKGHEAVEKRLREAEKLREVKKKM